MFSIEGSCEDCLEFFTGYQDAVLSEENFEGQINWATQICQAVDDPESCAQLISYFWPTLGNIFFYPSNTKKFCLHGMLISLSFLYKNNSMSWCV